MSDANDTKRPAKTLTLKKTETSTVKQSFSHGRTKAVVVEKKRAAHPTSAPAKPAPAEKTVVKSPAAEAPPGHEGACSARSAPRDARPGVVLRQLTEEEKARRGAALADARVHEEEARKLAEEESRRRVLRKKNACASSAQLPRNVRSRKRPASAPKKKRAATRKKKPRAAQRRTSRLR